MNLTQKTASLKYYTFECAEKAKKFFFFFIVIIQAFLNTINLNLEFAD